MYTATVLYLQMNKHDTVHTRNNHAIAGTSFGGGAGGGAFAQP